MTLRLSLILVAWFTSGVVASGSECDMVKVAEHKGIKTTKIYSSNTGPASLYYFSDMDVNTDGSARSYHPDDPRGNTKAFNNIGNGIKHIYNKYGKKITCDPRKGKCFDRFINTFIAARDSKYSPVGYPRFTSDGMIPWKMDSSLGWKTPCTIQDGPFKGYFVSQTSISVNSELDICNQSRYLDSFSFNAVVLPIGASWSSQETVTDDGDLVVVRDVASQKVFFAINGDRGPPAKIGEGTIALTAKLTGKTLVGNETYQDIRKLARSNVQYITFPKDDIRRLTNGVFTQADIDREGKRLLDAWGGVERLKACEALAH